MRLVLSIQVSSSERGFFPKNSGLICVSCPVLLVTGQLSVFNETTRTFHQAIVNTCKDKSKVDFVEVAGVANVIEDKVNIIEFVIVVVIIFVTFEDMVKNNSICYSSCHRR